MDGHVLLRDIALAEVVSHDGGPRGYHRRGKPLPEKYLPGCLLASMRPDARADVVRIVNTQVAPAPWFLQRIIVDEEPPRVALPPIDRRWSCRGRWSLPSPRAARRERSSR